MECEGRDDVRNKGFDDLKPKILVKIKREPDATLGSDADCCPGKAKKRKKEKKDKTAGVKNRKNKRREENMNRIISMKILD